MQSTTARAAATDSGFSDMEEATVSKPVKKDSNDTDAKRKERNHKKKEQKKRARQRRQEDKHADETTRREETLRTLERENSTDANADDVEIVYVPEPDPEELKEMYFRQFRKVFEHFRITEGGSEEGARDTKGDSASSAEDAALANLPSKARAAMLAQMKEDEEESENAKKAAKAAEEDPSKMSKKKMKRLTRLSVAALKQLVARPDVVEMHDVCAQDPKLLVHLKAYRNTVPVPRHWCAKRKYLQGKRGFEKPPFRLPDFIAQTGIIEMRQVVQDAESEKTLKGKMRDKVRPKVGKVDIDYNKLHDAFFKYQTKPKLSLHGDLYYEGKEFEVRLREKKPGILSDELKTALGMPVGVGSERFPPPWLIAMQRYGPPPSYPNLKIPGLNAPIPEGCSFGYHAGGWGKPPVDEMGRPLYGDVFGYGTAQTPADIPNEMENKGVDQDGEILQTEKFWGELESDEEEESEEEEESSDEEDKEGVDMDVEGTGLVTPATGLVTPSGVSSMLGGGATSSLGGGALSSRVGLDTPQSIELRKRQQQLPGAGDQPVDISNDGFRSTFSSIIGGPGDQTPQLYKILPEVPTAVKPNELMGSAKAYNVMGATKPGAESQGVSEAAGSEVSSGKKRKRTGDSSTTSGASSADKHGEAGAAKKYKEFKF